MSPRLAPILLGALLAALVASGCHSKAAASDPELYRGGDAPLSRAADNAMIHIPAGAFIAGSTRSERDAAYDAYKETAGQDGARKSRWFERERDRQRVTIGAYRIDMTPVTMAAYAEFVADTGHRAPTVDEATWKRQGFIQKYATEVARYNWEGGEPPSGRQQQPVVLVSWDDADAYCRWRGALVGAARELPSEDQFEKAARGAQGNIYPWGAAYEADKLDSAVAGPRDLVAVASHPDGASPYGVLDAAGNVFQWTSTPWPFGKGRMTVKGSAWDDYAGVGRGASRHGRRRWVRHAIVGFRCASDVE